MRKFTTIIWFVFYSSIIYSQMSISRILHNKEWFDFGGYATYQFSNDTMILKLGDKKNILIPYKLISETQIVFDNKTDTFNIKLNLKDSIITIQRDKNDYLKLCSKYESNIMIDTSLYVNFFKNKTYVVFPFSPKEPDFLIFKDNNKVICGDSFLNANINWRIKRINNNYFFETDLFVLKVLKVKNKSIIVYFGYFYGRPDNEEFKLTPLLNNKYDNEISKLIEKYK